MIIINIAVDQSSDRCIDWDPAPAKNATVDDQPPL
jgi:hypothetical protein